MKALPFIHYRVAARRYFSTCIFGLILGLTLASCGDSSVVVSIRNNTPKELIGVEVLNDKGEVTTRKFDLKAGEAISKQLSFSAVSPSDGHYVLRIEEHLPRDFGYYSNGIPLADKIEIEVRTDTVLIQME